MKLSKPIRIYRDDLTLLVRLAGEEQARTGEEVRVQDILHKILAECLEKKDPQGQEEPK